MIWIPGIYTSIQSPYSENMPSFVSLELIFENESVSIW